MQNLVSAVAICTQSHFFAKISATSVLYLPRKIDHFLLLIVVKLDGAQNVNTCTIFQYWQNGKNVSTYLRPKFNYCRHRTFHVYFSVKNRQNNSSIYISISDRVISEKAQCGNLLCITSKVSKMIT